VGAPAAQRTGPKLHQGDPVKISGFVLPVPGDRPQLARLLVRCCLVDAVPVGLPVLWPADQPTPGKPDLWLAIEGVMENETVAGQNRSVVRVRQVRPIPRPNGRWNHERPAMKALARNTVAVMLLAGVGVALAQQQLLVRMPPACNPCARRRPAQDPRR